MPPNGYFYYFILSGNDFILRKFWMITAKQKCSLKTNKSTLKRYTNIYS